jgi:hypothetical protein
MLIPQDVLAKLDKRDPADVSEIFIHHSAWPPTLDITKMWRPDTDEICVPYNAYVKKVSTGIWVVQIGRPAAYVPAAQFGMNPAGYSICVGGDYQDTPGDEVESAALLAVYAHIMAVITGPCPNVQYLLGHRDVAPILQQVGKNPSDYSTLCPGDRLYAHLPTLRDQTGLLNYPTLQ